MDHFKREAYIFVLFGGGGIFLLICLVKIILFFIDIFDVFR